MLLLPELFHFTIDYYETLVHIVCAGTGNRTRVSTLGRSHHATKLYPQVSDKTNMYYT
ncbi:MAG: hypothetical protein UV86_C0027G0001 [Candidatus Nomurabacteria bacterium GW2011_GWB1_43_20]|nr:MAG: hypothetical protein UV86_C0027G0001 [Candidatus Nomurabacteria bacterium GW2011_GWB1_43_20]